MRDFRSRLRPGASHVAFTAIGSGLVRTPVAGMGAVTAGKSAVASVMRTLALELGPQGVRVNVVSPGMVLTELNDFLPEELKSEHADSTPLRRNATPEDVAGAVLAMASGHAGFVTGADLPVNGGAAIG